MIKLEQIKPQLIIYNRRSWVSRTILSIVHWWCKIIVIDPKDINITHDVYWHNKTWYWFCSVKHIISDFKIK